MIDEEYYNKLKLFLETREEVVNSYPDSSTHPRKCSCCSKEIIGTVWCEDCFSELKKEGKFKTNMDFSDFIEPFRSHILKSKDYKDFIQSIMIERLSNG